MAKAWEHAEGFLSIASRRIKAIRFVATVLGALLIAGSQFARNFNFNCPVDEPDCALEAVGVFVDSTASTAFVVGLIMVLIANLVLVFVDKQSVETVRDLHKAEMEMERQRARIERNVRTETALVAWTTLTKVLSEVLDTALAKDQLSLEDTRKLYEFAIEAIAERRMRLFGIEDDYLNISLYAWRDEANELECLACYRSRPSDMMKARRSWKPGEGHVGKAFELQRPLICSDARVPDVAAWIAAPPGKSKPEDSEKYISLAAVPVGLTSTKPLGVLIMTSDVAGRFTTDANGESTSPHYGVAALQDLASQLAQIMFVIHSKVEANVEGETDE